MVKQFCYLIICCLVYIPIWLNSNLTFLVFSVRSITVYIPIWLNSNNAPWTLSPHIPQVYIPIWLNSNSRLEAFENEKLTGLHSNMVKFKSMQERKKQICLWVYIPIWLNSNISPWFIELFSCFVYIPIWLNSNPSSF